MNIKMSGIIRNILTDEPLPLTGRESPQIHLGQQPSLTNLTLSNHIHRAPDIYTTYRNKCNIFSMIGCIPWTQTRMSELFL